MPTGIGPVSTVWAKAMRDRGHEVEVVTAHPHYPAPRLGHELAPVPGGARRHRRAAPPPRRRLGHCDSTLVSGAELRGGEPDHRDSRLEAPDVVVAMSPSFPALAPAIAKAGVRRLPWVLWLQDLLPEGAGSTELVRPGRVLAAAQRLEHAAYRSADRIVVISDAFAENLRARGVPPDKVARIYNPSTRQPYGVAPSPGPTDAAPRVLTMGNIGLSQGLSEYVRWFQESTELERLGARLVVAGHGVAADEVRAAIRSDRVEMLGLVPNERLEQELGHAPWEWSPSARDSASSTCPRSS